VTGRPHRIEIWFAIDGETLYMLSGGGDRSDWVKNLRHTSAGTVEIGGVPLRGPSAVLANGAADERARTLVMTSTRADIEATSAPGAPRRCRSRSISSEAG
jgi:hypothetical protein